MRLGKIGEIWSPRVKGIPGRGTAPAEEGGRKQGSKDNEGGQ